MFFSKQNIPRWAIFLIDILIVVGSIFLAYMVRFNFSVPQNEIYQWPIVFSIILAVRALSFLISKTYAGMIRFTSMQDAVRIFIVIFSGSALFAIINLISYYLVNGHFIIPFSIIVIEFMTVVLLMITFRIVIKIAYLEIKNPGGAKTKVIIYGAGEAGVITKQALDRDLGIRYKVIAFIDEDKTKIGKKLEGVNIFGFDKLEILLSENDVDNLIISSGAVGENGWKRMCIRIVSKYINERLKVNLNKKLSIVSILTPLPMASETNTPIINDSVGIMFVIIQPHASLTSEP